MSTDSGSNRTRLLQIFTVTFAIMAISVNLYSLIFVTTKSSSMKSYTDCKETSAICLPCEQLTKNVLNEKSEELLKKLTKRQDGGIEKCCAENNEEMTALLELLEYKQKSGPQPVYIQGHSDLNHVSAFKSLKSPTSDDDNLLLSDGLVSLILDSTHEDPLTEHAQNVEILPSGFVIQYSGIYYVYSSVYFGPNSNKPCNDLKSQTWTHTVTRTRPNERQSSGVILTSLHTCCDDCKNDKETAYAAGVFSLEAGDHLHVEVSAHGLIRFQKESSFLGISMFGGQDDVISS